MDLYVPLWVKTSGSFLEGASQPEELVDRAKELSLPALAITDRDGVYGLVKAHVRAKEVGLRLIVGAEASLEGGGHVVVLAESREGYGAMCRMLTVGHARAKKGESRVTLDEVRAAALKGLVVLADDPSVLTALAEGDALHDRLFALCARHRTAEERTHETRLREAASSLSVPTVATIEVLYHDASKRKLADVLACIRHGVRIHEAGTRIAPNAEHALSTTERFRALFADDPASVDRTLAIAERCRFSLDHLRYRYPGEAIPSGFTEGSWLRELTYRGARKRYDGEPQEDVRAQLEHELALIEELDYGGYFLTMYDIVERCREEKILCQGRGSAANSVVCYCLGITAIDPVRMDLLFERFLSRERAEAPDIDLDIEHERREEIIQWLYDRRDRRHAAMVANVIRYRTRSAFRDVGKVFGIPETTLARLTPLLSHYGHDEALRAIFAEAGIALDVPSHAHLLELVADIQELPRHLSVHPGGFLLGSEPVDELVPVEPATMPGRTVIQWDKNDVDSLNLFKVDLLGLGCLSHIRRTFALLREHEGLELDMSRIPQEDAPTFAMLGHGDTVGVFQVESRAQMAMLPRLQPRNFYDIVVQVAIVRPGPIQGDMVHPYLRRRSGKEPVDYPHPSLERVLKKTLGVPIFQEQVMKLAVLTAGYTGGEADQLRRDMAAWQSQGKIERHRDRIILGMVERGIDRAFAERVFSQIKGFGEYGFPESHAASFALLAYVTAWLRRHHLAAFTCGLVNAQPMGFYSVSTILEDARRHGVEIVPVDVAVSAWEASLERAGEPARRRGHPLAVRMGFESVKGFGTRERALLEAAPGPYLDLQDFVNRTKLASKHLIALAEAGAFDSFGLERRDAIWAIRGRIRERGDSMPLPDAPGQPSFPPTTLGENIAWDHERMEHSTRGHPLEPIRAALRARGLPDANAVSRAPDGARIDYAGLVICRQHPGTAKGVTFYTLEDETGLVNVVVFRALFEKRRVLAKTAPLLGVRGRIERESGVTHLIAEDLFEPDLRADVAPKSRDFR